MVHRRLRKFIIDERMVKMNLKISENNTTTLRVYAVNENVDSFFEQLNEEIGNLRTSRDILILGDLNERIKMTKLFENTK